jgi:Na+/H+ antiporter NhaC
MVLIPVVSYGIVMFSDRFERYWKYMPVIIQAVIAIAYIGINVVIRNDITYSWSIGARNQVFDTINMVNVVLIALALVYLIVYMIRVKVFTAPLNRL